MKRPTKIMILGIGQSNFLDQLYGGIAQRSDRFIFDIDGYTEVSDQIASGKKDLYNQHFRYQSHLIPKLKLFGAFLDFASTGFFWQIVFFELSQRRNMEQIYDVLKIYARSRYIVRKLMYPRGYDVYHFHFCVPENLTYVHFLPKDCKIICSFWGSDLMRNSGTPHVFYVSKALQRASKITIQTEEMGEMLYCKYGRNLSSKLEFLRFTLDERIYDEMDRQGQSGESVQDFRNQHSIPHNHAVVALGHNAFQENNHLAMLQQLESLPAEVRKNTTFILHLSYGGSEQYVNQLVDYCRNHQLLNIRCILQYLGPADVAQLRMSTDVLLQMPVSDALSGAMTEVLYAGNYVIAGSWLPYGIMRRNGIRYGEIGSFDEIPTLLADAIDRLPQLKADCVINREQIRKFLFPDKTSSDWITIYDNLI